MTGSDGANFRTEQLEARILAHLRTSPGSVDSSRGVLQWWIGGLEHPPSLEMVEAALERLALRGRVRRIINSDRTVLWAAGDANGRG